ncbi:unnamed protein product, partial [Penicillium nalgiovense]
HNRREDHHACRNSLLLLVLPDALAFIFERKGILDLPERLEQNCQLFNIKLQPTTLPHPAHFHRTLELRDLRATTLLRAVHALTTPIRRPASLFFLLLNFLLFILKRLFSLFLSLASPPSPILRNPVNLALQLLFRILITVHRP